jgi:hypothetical protein
MGRAKNGRETMRETVTMEPVTLESVLAKENLNAAWLQVKANAGAAGVDGWSVERSRVYVTEHWSQIEAALLAGQYQPAPSPEEQHPATLWVYHPVESDGGTTMTAACFNRRMRKTARPVVWKGRGAQSPRPHPIPNRKIGCALYGFSSNAAGLVPRIFTL